MIAMIKIMKIVMLYDYHYGAGGAGGGDDDRDDNWKFIVAHLEVLMLV